MGRKREYMVKGTHIMMGRTWVDERLGEGTFRALADQVGSGWRSGWPDKLLPSAWYEVFPLNEILTLVVPKLGTTITAAVTEIATLNAREDLTTIYRAFMRVAGPKSLLNATPMLWRIYVNFAEAKKVENVPGLHVGECHMIPAQVFDWAKGCWHGFLPAAIELAGGKNASLKIVDEGDENEAGFCWLRAQIRYDL